MGGHSPAAESGVPGIVCVNAQEKATRRYFSSPSEAAHARPAEGSEEGWLGQPQPRVKLVNSLSCAQQRRPRTVCSRPPRTASRQTDGSGPSIPSRLHHDRSKAPKGGEGHNPQERQPHGVYRKSRTQNAPPSAPDSVIREGSGRTALKRRHAAAGRGRTAGKGGHFSSCCVCVSH